MPEHFHPSTRFHLRVAAFPLRFRPLRGLRPREAYHVKREAAEACAALSGPVALERRDFRRVMWKKGVHAGMAGWRPLTAASSSNRAPPPGLSFPQERESPPRQRRLPRFLDPCFRRDDNAGLPDFPMPGNLHRHRITRRAGGVFCLPWNGGGGSIWAWRGRGWLRRAVAQAALPLFGGSFEGGR